MRRWLTIVVAALTLALYAGVVMLGLRMGPRSLGWVSGAWLGRAFGDGPTSRAWRVGSMDSLSPKELRLVEYGSELFNETPVYGSQYAKARIACASCHVEGGIAPYSAPMVGTMQAYPKFSQRAQRKITLNDRIDECMTRSENGMPLPDSSHEMQALKAYIGWLSEPHRAQAKFIGRGLEPLPKLTPDPKHGAEIYAAQCAGCHGDHGEGTRRPFPPLWGPESFNDGAGMGTIPKMAAFVQYNMPQNRKGTLSAQEATDVAAFVHMQPRPKFNHAYDKY
ncbi:c-type cytochrome [Granulicella sp. 5B5]|uniref:c-type cytochrome n=1 Tax=Granulicella sp. 5B5 TaxID=1617967 RepID=UPI0015F5E741|nr:c-type cytochrome [Granulicella sp. 5B5]